MSEWVRVLDCATLVPGEMRGCEVPGLGAIAIYNVDGEFLATGNICTHMVAYLTDGYLDGETVECPFHGGCFNIRTGAATHPPCDKPLPVYRVRVADGGIFVEVSRTDACA